jgi:hypothetical protein
MMLSADVCSSGIAIDIFRRWPDHTDMLGDFLGGSAEQTGLRSSM